MRVQGTRQEAQLALCVASAPVWQLSETEAIALVRAQVRAVLEAWPAVAAEARLDEVTRRGLWRRSIPNDYAFEGDASWLAELRATLGRAGGGG